MNTKTRKENITKNTKKISIQNFVPLVILIYLNHNSNNT